MIIQRHQSTLNMKETNEKEFERLIDIYRRRSEIRLPLTEKQIQVFEDEMMKLPEMPLTLSDPDALLKRGYVSYEELLEKQGQEVQEVMEPAERYALAARNGQDISEESLQKIIRMIDEGDADKESKD
jgi:hypothetical protein